MVVLFAARMCRIICTLYLLESGVGIDLCGCKAGMPEQTLDGTYIRAVVEHRGGKSMPQDVGRVLLERGYLPHARADYIV